MAKDGIPVTLKRIEDKLDKSEKRAEGYRIYSSGIALMIAALAVLPYNIWGAIVTFVVGYVLMIFPFYKYRKLLKRT